MIVSGEKSYSAAPRSSGGISKICVRSESLLGTPACLGGLLETPWCAEGVLGSSSCEKGVLGTVKEFWGPYLHFPSLFR